MPAAAAVAPLAITRSNELPSASELKPVLQTLPSCFTTIVWKVPSANPTTAATICVQDALCLEIMTGEIGALMGADEFGNPLVKEQLVLFLQEIPEDKIFAASWL